MDIYRTAPRRRFARERMKSEVFARRETYGPINTEFSQPIDRGLHQRTRNYSQNPGELGKMTRSVENPILTRVWTTSAKLDEI